MTSPRHLRGRRGGGSFLVSPDVGLMIWTLLVFGISMYVLAKVAFPRIAEALDKRQKAIEESIETAERIKHEAERAARGVPRAARRGARPGRRDRRPRAQDRRGARERGPRRGQGASARR